MIQTLAARDVMSRPVRRLTERARMRDAVDFLIRHGISGAPVEAEQGAWKGVFSMKDVARAVADRLGMPPPRSLEAREPGPRRAMPALEDLRFARVGELMTAGLVTVSGGASLADVVRSFLVFGVDHVFVVEEESGDLEGVLTPADVMQALGRIGIAPGVRLELVPGP
jgi:CBS domain-containing protein